MNKKIMILVPFFSNVRQEWSYFSVEEIPFSIRAICWAKDWTNRYNKRYNESYRVVEVEVEGD